MAQKQQTHEHHEDVLAVFQSEKKAEKHQSRSQAAQEKAVDAAVVNSSMENELRSLLDEFDNEGTGTFDVTELVEISVALGEPLSGDEADLIVQDLDPANSGVVSFETFIKWWRRV